MAVFCEIVQLETVQLVGVSDGLVLFGIQVVGLELLQAPCLLLRFVRHALRADLCQ